MNLVSLGKEIKEAKRYKTISKIIPITAGAPQHGGSHPKASSIATGENTAKHPTASLWKGPTDTCSSLACTTQDQKDSHFFSPTQS